MAHTDSGLHVRDRQPCQYWVVVLIKGSSRVREDFTCWAACIGRFSLTMSQAPSFVLFLLWFDCVIVICNWSHILIACSFYFLVNLLTNCCCVALPSLALNEPAITWNWRRHKSLVVLGRSYTIIICSHRYAEPLGTPAMPPMNNGARVS